MSEDRKKTAQDLSSSKTRMMSRLFVQPPVLNINTVHVYPGTQTDKQIHTATQTDRGTDRGTDRQRDRQRDRQTEGQTDSTEI